MVARVQTARLDNGVAGQSRLFTGHSRGSGKSWQVLSVYSFWWCARGGVLSCSGMVTMRCRVSL